MYAGVGKSFASQSNATKAIYITPYNVLCQELMIKGHKSITLHRLMSLNFTGDSSKRKHFDVSEYDSIVFEEIMQYSPKLLSAIHRFMNLHPDKKFIANGDLSQNMPILFGHNNILSEENYLMLCINSMFPNQIILQVPKRLDNEIDREKIKNIKDDIFNTKLNIMDVWRKYNLKIINNIDEITTTTNVSYFRSRSYNINEFVQNKLIHVANEYIEHEYVCNGKQYVFKYYVGQKIICRQCFRRNNCHLFTNYIYEILDIKEDNDEDHIITIRNINDYIPMTITSKQLSNISLPYSSTCHSIQGSTIHEPYTIFDTNIVYADRHWIYTALTRCTSLDQVTIFEHPKVECSILERCKFKQYYKLKVDNYI